jgi:hypothetical protein
MKNLIASFIVLFMSLSIQANDTSGCNMRESLKETRTTSGNNLRVQYVMAPQSRCWNADDGAIAISYEWLQNNSDENHNAIFWTKINQFESTIKANISCKRFDNGGLYNSNSRENSYLCRAIGRIKIGYNENAIVEIAPQLDGSWDTKGFAQNYLFKFTLFER